MECAACESEETYNTSGVPQISWCSPRIASPFESCMHVQALSLPGLTLTKRRDYSQSEIPVMVSFVLKIKSFKSFTCPPPWANCTHNNTVWRVLHVLSTEACFTISVVLDIFWLWKIKAGPNWRLHFCLGIHRVLYLPSGGMRLTTNLAAKHADLLINK